MQYELTIESEVCDTSTIYPHTREGLTAAFARISKARTKVGFECARIVSDRDGEVFVLDNNLISA